MTREHRSFPSGEDWCAAYLYRPAEADGPVPCVVMAPGFSSTRDDILPAFAERFAAAGLAVVLFDYRHFGRSTGRPRQRLSIPRQLEDYRAAVRFARGLPGVDPERIALWGTSFSGGHVLALGAQGEDVAALVAQVPFADGLSNALITPPRVAVGGAVLGLADLILSRLRLGSVAIRVVGPPGSFAALTAAEAEPGFAAIAHPHSRWRNAVAARIMLEGGLYRPGRMAHKIARPLLVCVADDDETVPPGPAIAAAERAPYGELRRYRGGHFALYGEQFERAVGDQIAFLQRHLATARTAAPAAEPRLATGRD
jgi:dienelactone hydrolase